MPTATETSVEEAARWSELAADWRQQVAPELWAVRPPTERDVVVHFDPFSDLQRKAAAWGHHLENQDVTSLALFAAALARVEADGWSSDVPDLAVRAYEARRLLLADRIIHWAVPWFDAVRRSYPQYQKRAKRDRDFLLTLGDEMRVAPRLPGREGLVLDGEDSLGPLDIPSPDGWPRSLWSGDVLLSHVDCDLKRHYENASRWWRKLADRHPGSAQIWMDMGDRARRTSQRVHRW
jgi:hypothetical protein